MAIKIITDSTSDISLSEATGLDIQILPLRVIFGDEEFIDGVTLTAEAFYKKLKESSTLPHTSQITPTEFSEVFQQETADGSEVLGIFVSAELSGTFQSAQLAAQDFPGVHLVDSRLTTFALGALVRIAVNLRNQGGNAASIAAKLEEIKSRMALLAVIGDITYLVKGGRLSNAGGVLATALNIKPLITIKEGLVLSSGVARGMKKGYRHILQRMLKDGVDTRYPLVFGHSDLPEGAQELRELASKKLEVGHVPLQMIGTVVGAHAGPGAVGVVYVRKA